MSVIMTIHLKGDPAKLESFAAENVDHMHSIIDIAKGHGLIAHRFYGSDAGEIMVVDEWPDAESFQAFFAEAGPKIQPLMEASGVTSEPQPAFWRKLDSQDEVGWDAA